MAFTVASWNVEHFGKKRAGETRQKVQNRIDRVFQYLKDDIDCDVYAIYEVNGSAVFDKVKTEFPNYSWTISEGPGTQQILVGARIQMFVTHRPEFSRGFKGPLRPGVLCTVTDGGKDFPMLFLHLKAAGNPIDFGVRTHQHDKARSLRKALDRGDPNGKANFIVAGDLNNVGMNLSFSDRDIDALQEAERLAKMYRSNNDQMRLLPKTEPNTFWNGTGASNPPADLDHVIAADHITFEQTNGVDVAVLGWPQETTPNAKTDWINKFSDHALLRFKVTGA